ncbi:hypothetical protein E2N92_06825 [Methanofollis formosanus]|uniref:Lipoprotein n=1 Tax=Methanofollis formosanus TaxID=299308 RepID=A0A8G1A2E2_9EURY|nr:hypothetical protein [Methanofollis formosanus]QYZ79166.1 hypothetical protein E2N92_06825 [Methanofollis formosanus]
MRMQRRDLLVCFVLLVSLLACGCTLPGDDGTQSDTTHAPALTPASSSQTGNKPLQPVPTPPGQWDGKEPYEVKLVDPATYHITPTDTPIPTMKQPDDLHIDTRAMMNYATISSENSTGVMATEIYRVPTPYWELNYTVAASNPEYARFKIEIRDPNDPNRFVGEVSLDRADFSKGTNSTKTDTSCSGSLALREGFREYYFVIYPEYLRSFSVVVQVPKKYLV